MLKYRKTDPLFDTVPQAILWRPIKYFTSNPRQSSDELDEYKGAFFERGNEFSFDLRCYKGHSKSTTTMYLPFNIVDMSEILQKIKTVLKLLLIPEYAVAWKRGEPFEFGHLNQRSGDRLRETEARNITLKIASLCENHTASTAFIKKEIHNYVSFSSIDLENSQTRRNEQRWQQVVGNVISHKSSSNSIFQQGYAKRTSDGLQVTSNGLNYLKEIGFNL
jgi:hypothetical protein